MAQSYEIWPKRKWPLSHFFGRVKNGLTAIENDLQSHYDNAGFPVVISSGRAAISIIMEAEQLNRRDQVAIFPYASHCVIESIGTFANPIQSGSSRTGHNDASIKMHLHYHQLGYIQKIRSDIPLIEDAVDSLVTPGGQLFPAGGTYEIWSLPKICAAAGGAVVWCKDQQQAEKLRLIRNSRKNLSSLRWILRYLSLYFPSLYVLWAGSESWAGSIPGWALKHLKASLNTYPDLASERKQRFDLLAEHLPEWLSFQKKRLPVAVPLVVNEDQEKQLTELGFVQGARHVTRYHADGTQQIVKLFPVPVHEQVPLTIYKDVLAIMAQED